MKHLLTKLAFTASAIALLSGIILIRAMTTTDTQTIIEDIASAQDQMMDVEDERSAMDTTMTTEMQEIAEPGMVEMQENDEEVTGEEPVMEASVMESEESQPDMAAEEQPVADEEGTPSMEGLPEQEKAEQEAQEVNIFMDDESPAEGLAP